MANYNTQAVVFPYLPRDAFTDEETELLTEYGFTAHPCHGKNEEGLVYLYCEEYCGDEAIDVLEAVLKRLPEDKVPYIYLEAAQTCSKMRSDGFGGFAWFISREFIHWVSTGQWLVQQIHEYNQLKEVKDG